MLSLRAASVLSIVSLCAGTARGETFSVPVDTANSSITITLNLLGRSATDSSPVSGFTTVKLEIVSNPTQISVTDFDLALTEAITLNIAYGFPIFGNFNSTLTGFRTFSATPGTPVGPVLLGAGGAFSLTGLPANTAGSLAYTATGGLCTLFGAQMLPCVSTLDLSMQPPSTINQFNGTATVSGRTVTLTATIDQTSPIDPTNPALGDIRVQGTVRGTAVVPVIAGDANADCSVSFADITSVLSNFGGAGPAGDANTSGAVDFADVTAVLANFGNSCG